MSCSSGRRPKCCSPHRRTGVLIRSGSCSKLHHSTRAYQLAMRVNALAALQLQDDQRPARSLCHHARPKQRGGEPIDADVGSAAGQEPSTVRRARGAPRSVAQPSRLSHAHRQAAAADRAVCAAPPQGPHVHQRGQSHLVHGTDQRECSRYLHTCRRSARSVAAAVTSSKHPKFRWRRRT